MVPRVTIRRFHSWQVFSAVAAVLAFSLMPAPGFAQQAQPNGSNGASGQPKQRDGGVHTAVAVTLGSGWQEFSFFGVGLPSAGCQPTDPLGLTCASSVSGNSTFVGAPPWTFTGPATLIVTDAFTSGDVFNVFDNSTLLGTTSAATVGANCGSDPAVCSTDASTSHGTFNLGAGAHSITIVPTVASQRGAAYFRVDAPGGGGPGTCTLTQTATFSGGTLTLSYTIATSAPANWNIWLIAGGNALPLVNTPLPGISSATTLSFNVPNFPSLGTIGFLTTLTATPGGITCSDFDLVNT